MTDQRIFDLFTKAVDKARKSIPVRARLGLGDADKTLFVIENGAKRDGYIWARIMLPTGATPVQVLCRKTAAVYGAPVWIQENFDGILEVIEEDVTEAIAYFGEYGTGNAPQHAPSHGYYGHDSLRLKSLQIDPLLTRPNDTPGLLAYVEPLIYSAGGVNAVWDGGTIDLSPYVPVSTGYQRLVITALDMGSNTLIAFAGSQSFVNLSESRFMPFSRQDAASIETTGNVLLSAAVRLYAGQSRIDKWDVPFDMRQWFTGRSLEFDRILTDGRGDVLSDGIGNVLWA